MLTRRNVLVGAVLFTDKDALTEEAQRLPPQEASGFIEVRAGIDVETVIASAGPLSEEDIQAMEYLALQVLRVLTIVASVAILAASTALGLTQLATAVAGMYAFVEFVAAARKSRRGLNS